jgi:translation initiation factor IF-2
MICLRQQFADDQIVKEQSKLTSVKREKRETITLKDAKHEESS